MRREPRGCVRCSANRLARIEESGFDDLEPRARSCVVKSWGQRGYGVAETMNDTDAERFPVVHVHGGSAIRRPLIVLAVCAVSVIGYLARDFLIPTAAAIVLALMLTPVAKTL